MMTGDSLTLRESSEEFDSQRGWVLMQRYSGTLAALEAKRDEMAALGWKVRLVLNEGQRELIATSQDPTGTPGGEDDTIFDVWSLNTTFEQISVWADPNLVRYLFNNAIPEPAPASVSDAETALSFYKHTFENYLRYFYDASGNKIDGLDGPTPLANFAPKYLNGTTITDATELAFLKTFYGQVLRGADKSLLPRVTLERRRTLKTASASRYQVVTGQIAWATANLISSFDVPVPVQAILPATPGADMTPSGTTWAWALTSQEATTAGTPDRAVERLVWTFAACRSFTFTFNP